MKTEFELETTKFDPTRIEANGDKIKIIGKAPENHVYVAIEVNGSNTLFIQDKDLKVFATNLLKAIGEKRQKLKRA